MDYTRISADCHIDMPWIPPDLFTAAASAALRERMPYVTDGQFGHLPAATVRKIVCEERGEALWADHVAGRATRGAQDGLDPAPRRD